MPATWPLFCSTGKAILVFAAEFLVAPGKEDTLSGKRIKFDFVKGLRYAHTGMHSRKHVHVISVYEWEQASSNNGFFSMEENCKMYNGF